MVYVNDQVNENNSPSLDLWQHIKRQFGKRCEEDIYYVKLHV
jgi:hypothetical protein